MEGIYTDAFRETPQRKTLHALSTHLSTSIALSDSLAEFVLERANAEATYHAALSKILKRANTKILPPALSPALGPLQVLWEALLRETEQVMSEHQDLERRYKEEVESTLRSIKSRPPFVDISKVVHSCYFCLYE